MGHLGTKNDLNIDVSSELAKENVAVPLFELMKMPT
jgi:hypothetical protein